MTVRINRPPKRATYFVTFTCYKWMNLIGITNSYHAFYNWFEYLKSRQIYVLCYVIMPNHFHGVIHVTEAESKSLNIIISNAKRFVAFEITNYLINNNKHSVLNKLSQSMNRREKKLRQQHRVFEYSFDSKEIDNIDACISIINYIHHNPCRGKWQLVLESSKYKHSSAAFYELNVPNQYVRHFSDFVGSGAALVDDSAGEKGACLLSPEVPAETSGVKGSGVG